jgi:hypothetical protein
MCRGEPVKWIKHMTASWDDEKLARLVDSAGDDALLMYGLYWRVNELIAAQMDGPNPSCSVTYSVSRWSRLLVTRPSGVWSRVQKLASTCLLTACREGDDITVTNCNLLKYRDEYARKSGHAPDNVPPRTEGEQKEIKKEKEIRTKATPPAVTLPTWIHPESWGSFAEMRKEIRAPLTPKSIKLTINKLERLRAQGHDPAEVLDQSVQAAYRGVFEIKKENSNANGHNRKPTLANQLASDFPAEGEELFTVQPRSKATH